MHSAIAQTARDVSQLRWLSLSGESRELLAGKLTGLWGAPNDKQAFDSLAVDKQWALLLVADRLQTKDLWPAVRRISNVYGLGGVGIDFEAWPFLESTLSRRRDFTKRFAKRASVSGGFYEKGRRVCILHFLYTDGSPRRWHEHFDWYSAVDSLGSGLRHLRYEYFGKLRPDWNMVRKRLDRLGSTPE